VSKVVFGKLIDAMRKLSIDVIDREICKKLETLMLTSKEDLNPVAIKNLLASPLDFDTREIPDPYTQYVKHFIFMVKRNEKQGIQKYVFRDEEEGLKKKKV
jgi:hypothetical protein